MSEAPSFDQLSEESKNLLERIPDYPLDFNIFIFKGIHDIRPSMKDELAEFRLNLNGESIKEDGLTNTSKLQDRLLEILMIERHRRDIILLNQFINAKGGDKTIKPIQLKSPLSYEIKSPIFKKLQSSQSTYDQSFRKFAILQNLEFDFESDPMTDDELIEEFVSEELLNFNELYLKKDVPTEQTFEEIFQQGKFIRVVIPLAAQGILMGVDIEKELTKQQS